MLESAVYFRNIPLLTHSPMLPDALPKRPKTLRPRTGSDGFTLIEVIIASSVFVVLAAGVLTSTVMTRRSMNQALMRNIAFDAAQGFLDQFKGQSFGNIKNLMTGTTPITLICNDVRNQKTASVSVQANQTDFLTLENLTGTLGDQRIPINTTNPDEPNTPAGAEKALESMVYVPQYGIRVTLSPVTDTPPANVDGSPNAIRITVNYRYKYSPSASDADFKTGAVSYLLPNI
jgi:prepilin-type N-terminal cleavage/methylation domain-containing protein